MWAHRNMSTIFHSFLMSNFFFEQKKRTHKIKDKKVKSSEAVIV